MERDLRVGRAVVPASERSLLRDEAFANHISQAYMRVIIDVAMDYAVTQADPPVLVLTAAEVAGQSVRESSLEIESATLRRAEGEGGIGERVWAFLEGTQMSLRYRATVDVERRAGVLNGLGAAPVHALPNDVFPFVRPSRYCPSDLLASFAEREFGHLQGGEKIVAMAHWIAGALKYRPGTSGPATTAVDTFVSREGVCRDYAHLLCGLARAASIPARYTSGYSAGVVPPDFHAVAEIWLDGAWHLVDPTGMSSSADFVVIGSGRDAGDVPFMETEKPALLIRQNVAVTNGIPV